MLRRTTKIQLILFVVITLAGISYVSASYVGLTRTLFGNDCTLSADFANSGGIFTNAEVTYRGVTVGQVGTLHLVGKTADLPEGGVRVDLKLDDCDNPRIPADSTANVRNRSVVGEQYVDLVPTAGTVGSTPALTANALIPATRTTTPVPTQDLLLHLDQFVNSVPLDKLSTTLVELDQAFSGRGNDLQTLLDSTNALLATANTDQNVKATTALIVQAATVLQTQLDKSDAIASWTHSLNLLSEQLKKSDPDIRRLLDNGPGDLSVLNTFIVDNRTDFGITLANLANLGNLIVRHLDGIEEVLELYPPIAAGGQSFLRDGRGNLGLVLQASPTPQGCADPSNTQFKQPGDVSYPGSYSGTVIRYPSQLQPIAPNVSVRCTAPASSNVDVRGSANVPGGDPISVSGGGYAYARTSTASTSTTGRVGSTSAFGPGAGASQLVNDGRYVTMLTASLG